MSCLVTPPMNCDIIPLVRKAGFVGRDVFDILSIVVGVKPARGVCVSISVVVVVVGIVLCAGVVKSY